MQGLFWLEFPPPERKNVRMKELRIAVIGGGIGGLTLAFALKARGLSATVYEGAPQLSAIGAGIWLPANAMKVMEALGLDSPLSARGIPLRSIELTDQEQLLNVIELERIQARLGQTTISILRTDLQEVLAQALGSEHIITGKRARSVEGQVVHFEDGTEISADVIVGADGLRSVVREAVAQGTLRYSGQVCHRGVAQLRLPPALHDVCRETWGGAHRIGYSAVKPDQVYWFAVTVADAGGKDEGSAKELLLQRYANFAPIVREILAATPEQAISRLDMYDVAPLPRWSKGPYVLLGDAAHAMTPNLGQGGAQAIEDAFSLARCLSEAPEPWAAFAAYEHERGPRARRIARLARQLGATAHWTNPVARAVRNAVFRHMPQSMSRAQTDSVYGINPSR